MFFKSVVYLLDKHKIWRAANRIWSSQCSFPILENKLNTNTTNIKTIPILPKVPYFFLEKCNAIHTHVFGEFFFPDFWKRKNSLFFFLGKVWKPLAWLKNSSPRKSGTFSLFPCVFFPTKMCVYFFFNEKFTTYSLPRSPGTEKKTVTGKNTFLNHTSRFFPKRDDF